MLKSQTRPLKYNVVLKTTDIVYVSYVKINGRWMRGLFARMDIPPNTELGRYIGAEYSDITQLDSLKDKQYIFEAKSVQNPQHVIYVDGNPSLYENNLVGYANYADNSVANAKFMDFVHKTRGDLTTDIRLVTKERIPHGVEIRVDYDLGVLPSRPYRDQMVRDYKLDPNVFKDQTYKSIHFVHPGGDTYNTEIKRRPPGRPRKNKTWDRGLG
jgi:hypothetical protein